MKRKKGLGGIYLLPNLLTLPTHKQILVLNTIVYPIW